MKEAGSGAPIPPSPSPPTRSSVTFARLLPAVGPPPTAEELAKIVAAVALVDVHENGNNIGTPGLDGISERSASGRALTGAPTPGRRAGMDVRRFRRGSDPASGGWRQRIPAGTDMLRFRGPPDPAAEWTRVALVGKGKTGTDVLGFRVPPDGGKWRPRLGVRNQKVVAGTEERGFRRPPDGYRTRWNRMLAMF